MVADLLIPGPLCARLFYYEDAGGFSEGPPYTHIDRASHSRAHQGEHVDSNSRYFLKPGSFNTDPELSQL